MKVILTQTIPKLGEFGEVVTVKDGYARNYLIPKGLALPATPSSIKTLELIRKQREGFEEKRKIKIQELAEKLEGLSVDLAVKVDDEDRLFGSVTAQMIADALKEKGFDIDKKCVIIEEPIQNLGVYTIKIQLSPDVVSSIRLWVVKD